MTESKVAVVTGASRGIGAAVAVALARRGITVYGISRSGTAPEGVTPLTADVASREALCAAVDTVIAREGRCDLAVLAAGIGVAGATEHIPEEEAARQIAVNLLGVDNALAVLTPALRESRGRVLAIGSVAGVFPIPFPAHYSASKAAVEALVRAYAGEVRPLGIRAAVALLGDTSTGFTDARRTFPEGDEQYGGRLLGSIRKMERDERGGASPERVADVLVRRLLGRRLPLRFTVGGGYRLLVLLDRLLPTALVDRIVGGMYK
ncbi:MAG: SDR family NAD(P)-dependent oxidoreductase [Clostridia bacterium]|nr:SDR family NAD(P)-dependent oxidoreductase [Clostridia bacterium]